MFAIKNRVSNSNFKKWSWNGLSAGKWIIIWIIIIIIKVHLYLLCCKPDHLIPFYDSLLDTLRCSCTEETNSVAIKIIIITK